MARHGGAARDSRRGTGRHGGQPESPEGQGFPRRACTGPLSARGRGIHVPDRKCHPGAGLHARSPTFRRVPKVLVILLGGIAVALVLVAYANRNRFRYRPTPLTTAEHEQLGKQPGWQPDLLTVAPDVVLRGLVRRPSGEVRDWILFFPGNGNDLLRGAQHLLSGVAGDEGLGLAVWSYRGFDGSGGVPAVRAFIADSEACVEHLVGKHGADPGRIHLMSFSLGTALALRLAATMGARGRPPRSLVLLSPYDRIHVTRDVWWAPWSFADVYDALAPAPFSGVDALLVHGTADDAVPLASAEALARALGQRAELVALEGRGHADWLGDPAVLERVRGFVLAHVAR